ncbi:nuclear transport factor 2 family protein [Leifsonia shinshuensis]|uniref:nuclear transport factor 2 family protein n=1 Tax=Leifsonia shinshuensis TaxID=150026 RepID=UPI00286A2E69|nr:nuclear transport factor 2 family protein [Leifsonia shinshuensis]
MRPRLPPTNSREASTGSWGGDSPTSLPARPRSHASSPCSRAGEQRSREPVSVLGAWRNATGQEEIDELFAYLAASFSDCTSSTMDLVAFDVVGDMAYTAALEHTSVSVDGRPRTYTLRATQVYRREDGQWRVAHRHGDTLIDGDAQPPSDESRPPS